jgi:CDP-diacylglycerol--glycerol-3-phosphate 3-phosphatidyltransferase
MSTHSTSNPAIDDLTRKLDTLAPRFELETGEIQVLTTPEEFYATLRKKILSAKKRVFLSSLYIGKEEKELVPILIAFLIQG